MLSSETIDLSDPPEGFQLQVGDVVIYESERIVPLGGVVYSADEILSNVRDDVLDDTLRQGLELVSVSSAIQEVGTFRYRLRIRFRVLAFRDQGVQEAAINIFWGVVVLAGILVAGYAAYVALTISREAPETVRDVSAAVTTLSVAAALLGLVYLLTKRS